MAEEDKKVPQAPAPPTSATNMDEAMKLLNSQGNVGSGHSISTPNTVVRGEAPGITSMDEAMAAISATRESELDDDLFEAEQELKLSKEAAEDAGFDPETLDKETEQMLGPRLVQAVAETIGFGSAEDAHRETIKAAEGKLHQLKRQKALSLSLEDAVHDSIQEPFANESDLTFGQRRSVAEAENIEEVKLRLQKFFPHAEVTVVPYIPPTNVLGHGKNYTGAPIPLRLYKKDAADSWRPLDGTIEEVMPSLGSFRVDPQSTWAQISKETTDLRNVGAVGGSILAAIFSGGISTFLQAGGAAMSAFAGSAIGGSAEEVIERSRGVSAESHLGAGLRIFNDATYDAIFEGFVPFAVASKNFITKKIFQRGVSPDDVGYEITRATGELGAKPLPRGLTSDNPLERRAFEQSLESTLTGKAKRDLLRMNQDSLDRLEKRALSGVTAREYADSGSDTPAIMGFNDETLARWYMHAEADLHAQAQAAIGRRGVAPSDEAVGAAFKRGLKEWRRKSAELGDSFYNNLSKAWSKESRFFSGVTGKGGEKARREAIIAGREPPPNPGQAIIFNARQPQQTALQALKGVYAQKRTAEKAIGETADDIDKLVAERTLDDMEYLLEPRVVIADGVPYTNMGVYGERLSRTGQQTVRGPRHPKGPKEVDEDSLINDPTARSGFEVKAADKPEPAVKAGDEAKANGDPDAGPQPTVGEDGKVEFIRVDNMPKKFRNLLEKFIQMAPDVKSTPQGSAYDIMAQWRRQFGDFVDSDNATVRSLSKKIYKEITESIEKPIGPESKQFLKEWNLANRFWRRTEFFKRKTWFMQAINDKKSPHEIVKKFMRPENAPMLRQIRQMIGTEQFEVLRQAYKAQLLETMKERPSQFLTQLTRMEARERVNKEFLDIMFEPEEWAALKKMAQANEDLLLSPGYQMYRSELNAVERGRLLEQSNFPRTPANLRRMRLMREEMGLDSPFAKAARAHFLQKALDTPGVVTLNREVGKVIDAKAWQNVVTRLIKDDPVAEMWFRSADLHDLANEELYLSWLPSRMESGASLQVHSLSARKRKIINVATLGMTRAAARSSVIVDSMSRPGPRRLLRRRDMTRISAREFATWAAVMKALQADMEQDAEKVIQLKEMETVRSAVEEAQSLSSQ